MFLGILVVSFVELLVAFCIVRFLHSLEEIKDIEDLLEESKFIDLNKKPEKVYYNVGEFGGRWR